MDSTRRLLIKVAASVAAISWFDLARAATAAASGSGRTFSFASLRERAESLSDRPYTAPPVPHPQLLDRIDYDTYQKISFRSAKALWRDDGDRMPVQFFHLGRYARHPVRIFSVADGQAHPITFSPSFFDYGDTGLGDRVPRDLGFSGFRVMNPGDRPGDWLAFQGASYFRSAGPMNQYGLSARGIAIDTAVPDHAEQFPRFTEIYLEQPHDDRDTVIVYALLEGKSVTGAYRFRCTRADTIRIDVHADLFMRETVSQLGIAPLTS
ncbi:MAG TPA: glucan biosynthesis protein, partial [Gammaproteobacteria bacterium]|nr:glucan biosynthesis protein [Gammaproteobacteria bacterium]